MKEKTRYFVYVLELSNGALYTGIARDVSERFRCHERGTASRYTRSFPPVRIAGCWQVLGGRGAAMSVEAFIKGRSRAAKKRLLAQPGELLRAYRAHRANPANPANPANRERAGALMPPGVLDILPVATAAPQSRVDGPETSL